MKIQNYTRTKLLEMVSAMFGIMLLLPATIYAWQQPFWYDNPGYELCLELKKVSIENGMSYGSCESKFPTMAMISFLILFAVIVVIVCFQIAKAPSVLSDLWSAYEKERDLDKSAVFKTDLKDAFTVGLLTTCEDDDDVHNRLFEEYYNSKYNN